MFSISHVFVTPFHHTIPRRFSRKLFARQNWLHFPYFLPFHLHAPSAISLFSSTDRIMEISSFWDIWLICLNQESCFIMNFRLLLGFFFSFLILTRKFFMNSILQSRILHVKLIWRHFRFNDIHHLPAQTFLLNTFQIRCKPFTCQPISKHKDIEIHPLLMKNET